MKQPPLKNPLRFSNAALVRLLVPLVLEQLLSVTVGMADTMMVSSCGEAAVSGIALVDQINILLIQVFAALATGGAVVASQYLGRSDNASASRAAKQLLWLTAILATVLSAAALLGNRGILRFVFGSVEENVMTNAMTYFWLTALSYPFLGLYNAGAALFRSMGNSKVSLNVSLIMNVINIFGNAVLIFGFGMGVAGAAVSTLVSRIVAGLVMVALLRSPQNPIRLKNLLHPQFSAAMLKSIFGIGVPSGLENGMFQIGKLLVASLVASFGTTAIAANAVTNSIAGFTNVPGGAVGLAMIAVVGQCVGAKDYEQARYYIKKLMMISYAGMALLSVIVYFAAPGLLRIYSLTPDTTALSLFVLRYNCVCSALVWVPSFTMPNALRAAGDAKYTMAVSMGSMWLFRVALSYVLGAGCGLGFFGVWMAMTIDWLVRGVFFVLRYRSGKWQNVNVIDH